MKHRLASSSGEERKKAFKRGVDPKECRRRRQETTLQLRKKKKESHLAKRRQVTSSTCNDTTNAHRWTLSSSISHDVVQGIFENDRSRQLECTTETRKLLAVDVEPPIQEAIDCGLVPRLIEFLKRNEDPALQFEAAWALANISASSSNHTAAVVDAGAVPVLISLLNASLNNDVCNQAIWVLGNIAGNSTAHRDMVLHAGAVPPLLRFLKSGTATSLQMVRHILWTISNLCRGKPKPDTNLLQPVLAFLAHFVQSNDAEIVEDTCWALSYLSDGSNDDVQAIIDTNVVDQMVCHLQNPNPKVLTPALRVIGNLVTGTNEQTQVVLDHNALPHIVRLLGHAERIVVTDACWALSNICAGTQDQIQIVINNGAIPQLIWILANAEYSTRREAAYAIAHALEGGSHNQVRFLVLHSCIQPLCVFLKIMDFTTIMSVLDGLESVLKYGEEESQRTGLPNPTASLVAEAGGLETMEELQMHENQEIYEKSVSILEQYFDTEVEEEVPFVVPAVCNDENGNQFAFGLPTGNSTGEVHPFHFSG